MSMITAARDNYSCLKNEPTFQNQRLTDTFVLLNAINHVSFFFLFFDREFVTVLCEVLVDRRLDLPSISQLFAA